MPRYTKNPETPRYDSLPDIDGLTITDLYQFVNRYIHPSIDDARALLGERPNFKKAAKLIAEYANYRAQALSYEMRAEDCRSRYPDDPRPARAAELQAHENWANAESVFEKIPVQFKWRSARPVSVKLEFAGNLWTISRNLNNMRVYKEDKLIFMQTYSDTDTAVVGFTTLSNFLSGADK
jgi:hypothetical protein